MTENEGIPYAVLENARPFQESHEDICYVEVGERDGTKLLMACGSSDEGIAIIGFVDDGIAYSELCERQVPYVLGKVTMTSCVQVPDGGIMGPRQFVRDLRHIIDETLFWSDTGAFSVTFAVLVKARPYDAPIWGDVRPSKHVLLARCAMRLGSCVRIVGSIGRDHADDEADELIDGLLETIDWDLDDNIWDVVESMTVVAFRLDDAGGGGDDADGAEQHGPAETQDEQRE